MNSVLHELFFNVPPPHLRVLFQKTIVFVGVFKFNPFPYNHNRFIINARNPYDIIYKSINLFITIQSEITSPILFIAYFVPFGRYPLAIAGKKL